MAIKMVDGIKMKNGMDEVLETKGAVTEDGKFVAACQARFVKDPQWSPSKKGNGTEYSIIMRLDISVSFMDGDKQGGYLIPYVSGRVLHLRGGFGERISVATPFDNDAKKQYPNLIIDQGIFNAVAAAINWATDDATERADEGRPMVTASNSVFISNANKLLAVSQKLATDSAKNKKVEEGHDTKAGQVSAQDDVVNQVLGTKAA